MKFLLLSMAALLLASFTNAQTVDEIINKHVEALGGKDKLSQIKSISYDEKIEIMGNESSETVTILNGQGFKMETDFNDQQRVQVVTDKGGWAATQSGGASDAEAFTTDHYRLLETLIYLPDALFKYSAHGAKVELEGREEVDTVNAYKIKYISKDSAVVTFYIDPSTYYIIETVKQREVQGQQTTISSIYSDYRKTDFGVYLPYTINTDYGQSSIKRNINKVDINKDVNPSIFEMPK
ncbi:MAG: hypothetical protein M3R72_12215 [Bacteroidota bacterium]|nr:hypothetical protein [Bacteroidota bacterium]